MPTTTHHIKCVWTDGTNTEFTTTTAVTDSTDTLKWTDGSGHDHEVQKKNTRDIERWDSAS